MSYKEPLKMTKLGIGIKEYEEDIQIECLVDGDKIIINPFEAAFLIEILTKWLEGKSK